MEIVFIFAPCLKHTSLTKMFIKKSGENRLADALATHPPGGRCQNLPKKRNYKLNLKQNAKSIDSVLLSKVFFSTWNIILYRQPIRLFSSQSVYGYAPARLLTNSSIGHNGNNLYFKTVVEPYPGEASNYLLNSSTTDVFSYWLDIKLTKFILQLNIIY